MSTGTFIVPGDTLSLQVTYCDGQVSLVDFTDGQASGSRPPLEFESLYQRLQAYLQGQPQDFSDVPLRLDALTPFRRHVLSVLKTIPYGTVRSYGWLAKACDKPGGAQAVGQALGHNPTPVILPCHRIIGADGQLGGFMRNAPEGGSIKTRLLTLEGYLQA